MLYRVPISFSSHVYIIVARGLVRACVGGAAGVSLRIHLFVEDRQWMIDGRRAMIYTIHNSLTRMCVCFDLILALGVILT
ncbi:hypothetical protein P691DRAFT_123925 [Macrolepiota fuliginosa MF-IS2]|uniref:Uncharacterized protein n=1 Tax=Macrolepiota fuliginosa MF-IS2 TaxID=1400762 RepID=A0A9P6BWF8_9AGAR|nr:hypothetical protein P691DRAFT_123925 [Macrolepiota fuliginosa MF-IS2]